MFNTIKETPMETQKGNKILEIRSASNFHQKECQMKQITETAKTSLKVSLQSGKSFNDELLEIDSTNLIYKNLIRQNRIQA
uniref:Uncharacterized protein n=1 Tax=Panagrolaimus sp. JU765 TaxID=591449 RepID=A0AC34QE61_9BILA